MWKLIHNTGQNPNNTFKVHSSDSGCCGSEKTECKYTATTDFAADIVSVTIDGEVMTFAIPAGTNTMLKAGIDAALASKGYEDWDNVGTRIVDGSVEVTGQANITVISTAAADIAVTKACTKVTNCNYKTTIVGSVPSITWNGTAEALTPTSYAYTSGDANANNTVATGFKGAIEDALDTLNSTYVSVTVTPNDVLEAFDVVIKDKSNATYYFSQKALLKCDCRPDFE